MSDLRDVALDFDHLHPKRPGRLWVSWSASKLLRRGWRLELLFEPRDIWVGVFIDRAKGPLRRIYFCPIPMVALVLVFFRRPQRIVE